MRTSSSTSRRRHTDATHKARSNASGQEATVNHSNDEPTNAGPFDRYVSLGDSMSIDIYPGLDDMERAGRPSPTPGLGAASLLARDLGVESLDLCVDGATTKAVLQSQLPQLDNHRGRTLVTLTAGGNDLLALIGAPPASRDTVVTEALDRLEQVLVEIHRRLPDAVIVMTTVYDPTDGTGQLGPHQLTAAELAALAAYNEGVRRLARAPGRRLADVHAHFLGHGLSAPPEERWYWAASPIEPGVLGASEIRNVWLRALE